MLRLSVVLLLGAAASAAGAADLPFVNWENHPVHALDLSPDGRLLAVAHTADQRVQFFDVASGEAVPAGHVVVGVDPVSVRFRNANELWVVNHISDSVSIVDVATRRVTATLATADEPYDVVFARSRAFVSCSQANEVLVFDPDDLAQAPQVVPIQGEDPRALAVSRDGGTVYAAIFESGNATTVLAGGFAPNNRVIQLLNPVSDPRGPYGGQNPPPNAGTAFDPPRDPSAPAPAVGLIVRKQADARWRDDNGRDWTELVSGPLATVSGRRVGWDLPDRDLALIDADSLAVRYATGLMNINMALAVNPASGEVGVVGTEAHNEVRYEPNVNGRFVRVHLARVPAAGSGATVVDLNAHLDYRTASVPAAERARALGDPRALAWSADGRRGWVAGMGSNNVLEIDAAGARVGAPIEVGQGPLALALDEAHGRLYAWNHFDASLSTIDLAARRELARTEVFDPLPQAIRAGRPLLYDTRLTSGLGQSSCASCHVDARMDRLAWDLGDPAGAPAPFDQNCLTTIGVQPCQAFHAMKGPMTTQTLQDIIGHEPLHWRGDRAGLEAFNPAYESLLGDDAQLAPDQMQKFEDFLATIVYPPNPFRRLDNTLPTALPLRGQYTSARFGLAGRPLGTGDAQRGLQLYTRGLLDAPFQCANCHTLPTGMAANGPLFLGTFAFSSGGMVTPAGPHGENHLGIVSVDGSTNVSIKVPHLRNQYEKVGFELGRSDGTAGFGFLHDGSVDSLATFLSARAFSVGSDQDVADLVALMMAFSGSDFGNANPLLGGPAPPSRDTHAAVGAQAMFGGGSVPARIEQFLALARVGAVDLVVRAGAVGHAYDRPSDSFLASDGAPASSPTALQSRASAAAPQLWTVVPAGLAVRLGIDRDGDGVRDAVELRQGSNPADAASTTLRPAAGLWYNPQRSGHGFDLQFFGAAMAITWYTYLEDGSPIWYQALGPAANPWVATLNRFSFDPATRGVSPQAVGEVRLAFDEARVARFDWRLGERSGSEPVQRLIAGAGVAAPDRTGTWYDPADPGWGLSLYSEGGAQAAVMYFYDGDNQPRWVLGQAPAGSGGVLPMASFRGFCPGCAAIPTTTSDGGQIELRFDAARRASVTTDVFHAAQPQARWRRGPATIVPLSDGVLRPESF
jgi:YVTN family beta-propeller protein